MKQYSADLDEQDLAILRALQAENLSNVELARRVNLSAPATHARVKICCPERLMTGALRARYA